MPKAGEGMAETRWHGVTSYDLKQTAHGMQAKRIWSVSLSWFPQAAFVIAHLAALILCMATEKGFGAILGFGLSWLVLNAFWIMLLRRPATAALLSLTMLGILVALSQLKHAHLLTTVSFIDVMIIDADTIDFLMTIIPGLRSKAILAAGCLAFLLLSLAWLETARFTRSKAISALVAGLLGLTGIGLVSPPDSEWEFYSTNYVSKFAFSGVAAARDLTQDGLMRADRDAGRLPLLRTDDTCPNTAKLPHILYVFDESSFDLSKLPTIKTTQDPTAHFVSFDGKTRELLVDGAGGPSWLTEYNVLTGLSARSFGRFSDFVTRIAAGRVQRGLPLALKACGYKTFSLYPMLGNFLGAKRFQETTGIDVFLDSRDLKTRGVEPDGVYFNHAMRILEKERRNGPLFMKVYTAANHFPWNYRFRPDLLPHWRDPGNGPDIDEYLRRQAMSVVDYKRFKTELARRFPGEKFLIIRFGDHQPGFAKHLIDKSLDTAGIARLIEAGDTRFFSTYYAIDVINFKPVDTGAARQRLEAAYLPIVALEAAGIPLDSSFSEQKRLLEQCEGLFQRCEDGLVAQRFNGMLIETGLIKGL